MRKRLVPIALLAALAAGCGAKTGLDVPDVDAGVDAGTDAGVVYPCVEVVPDGGPILLPLELDAQLARADVFFLIDVTLSMEAEISRVRERLRDTIAPGITRTIPDSMLGAGVFADFPEGACGQSGDDPFRLVVPITADLNRVQAAIDTIRLQSGGDRPEAQVPALYMTATGEGFGRYVPPSFGCPSGGVGYPCFRPDALSIILLFTDAPFHNGPGGSEPYAGACSVSPTPQTYRQALEALQSIDARVIGLFSGPPEDMRDVVTLARDTGTIGDDGPIVFDIGQRGERLSESVIRAIEILANVIRFDVDTVLVDPDRSDDVDPREFVEAVVPLRAEPMANVESIDRAAGVFRGVLAGTRVIFELRIVPGAVVPGARTQRYLLEIVFRGDGRTRLGSRIIEIVIPGEDGEGCENPTTP